MLDEIIAYHRWAAYGLLTVMLINLIAPYILHREITRMIFWTRVGYFAFWAFWTMVVFGGLITWLFTLRHWPMTVITMVGVAAVLAFMDGYRSVQLRRLWIKGDDGVGFNFQWLGTELVLTLVTIFYGLYG